MWGVGIASSAPSGTIIKGKVRGYTYKEVSWAELKTLIMGEKERENEKREREGVAQLS